MKTRVNPADLRLPIVVLVLVLTAWVANRAINAHAARDAAETARIMREADHRGDWLRCREAEAWMLAAPEAKAAEAYLRLLEEGKTPVEVPTRETMKRLELVEACREPEASSGG